MSLKAIEMQVALPRTLDVGKIQEQMQQRSQNMINIANDAVQHESEKKSNSVIKNEQSAETKLNKDEKKHNQNGQKHEHVRSQPEEKEKEHHPYKGTVIDYSG
jgi:hypothetical protein